jgi:hypothetical protein
MPGPRTLPPEEGCWTLPQEIPVTTAIPNSTSRFSGTSWGRPLVRTACIPWNAKVAKVRCWMSMNPEQVDETYRAAPPAILVPDETFHSEEVERGVDTLNHSFCLGQ